MSLYSFDPEHCVIWGFFLGDVGNFVSANFMLDRIKF